MWQESDGGRTLGCTAEVLELRLLALEGSTDAIFPRVFHAVAPINIGDTEGGQTADGRKKAVGRGAERGILQLLFDHLNEGVVVGFTETNRTKTWVVGRIQLTIVCAPPPIDRVVAWLALWPRGHEPPGWRRWFDPTAGRPWEVPGCG